MYAPPHFNQNGRQYFLTANSNVMVCVQIESRKAVENVEEIASVHGVGKLRPVSLRASVACMEHTAYISLEKTCSS